MKIYRLIFSVFILVGLLSLFAIIFQSRLTAQPVAPPPPLPRVVPYYDAKAYAWLWDAPAQTWRLLPRNEARILWHEQGNDKQLTGTLVIDGRYAVPAIPGSDVQLLFRKSTDLKTYPGLPAGESGIEVTRLEVMPGAKPGSQLRYAPLQRLGEAAATFGEKREPITVQQIKKRDGVYHLIRATAPLSPGRYALYLPDRAFEFEIKN